MRVQVTGDNVPDAVVDGRQGIVVEANVGAVFAVNGQVGSVNLTGVTGWANVQRLGAVGNGIIDDTAAIQAVIDACPPGGTVYLPRGVYKTTTTLDLKNGVSLRGEHANLMVGPGMTGTEYPCFIQPAATFTGTSVIQIIGDTDGGHPNISGEQRITDLMIDGSLLTGSVDGLYARGNVQNVVLDNVTIRQATNNGIVTASRSDGTYPYSWRLHHVMVDNCHANGILLTGCTDVTLDDVQAIGCWGQGFILENCTNGQMLSCRAEWNGSHGYHITGAWGDWAGSGGMQITGCQTDRNGQHGLLVDATGNTPILVSGLQTRRDGRNGGSGGGGFAGLAVIGATVPVVVDDITCYPGVDDGDAGTNSPQYGARLSGSTTVLLDNAYLHANTAGLLDDGTNTTVSYGANLVTAAGATTQTVRTLSNPYKGMTAARYVVANNASAREKARADYLCDGIADQVQIQAAIDAVQAEGGGIVQLSPGGFNIAATIEINGTLDENDPRTVTLKGCGQQVTELTVASGVTGITISDWAQIHLEKLCLFISGAGIGIKSIGVNDVGDNNNVSFWHSSFRDLRINGGFVTTATTWAMELGMPWRSTFENIEIEGCRNGIKIINDATMQNAGDCVFSRFFVEIVGAGGYALYVDSIDGNMNQNTWVDFEAGAGTGRSGNTGIWLGGTAGTASQRFIGNLNLERFATLINVANGNSNVFDANYITCEGVGATNKGFVTGTNSYNNTFRSAYFNIASGDTVQVIEDANTTSNAPNIFERIRIENNTSGTVTYSKTTSTVLRDITTFNTGNAMPDGLLQYPLSTVNDATFTPADHGLVAWTHDPATLRSASNATTSGTVYLCKVKVVNRSTLVSNVIVGIEAAGVTLTSGQCFVGLYNSSGTRLAVSADQSGNWTSTGLKTIALTAAQTLAVGSYYVAILAVGTTPPQFAMGAGGATTASAGLTASTARFLTGPTGQTSLPSSITLSSQTVTSGARWAALS
ncbi:glycosyl hydrolase family 28-related protein [Streptomyces chartreusis]|uniref:right-handed parallel beta-helix repeat-containing protein n=1 Tax=Streptomyces chartreusis TaxID=1969 RepID=UPI00369FF883